MRRMKYTFLLYFTIVLSTSSLADTNNSTSPYYPIYPATENTEGQSAEAIKRGEYLVKMGDCISCHTDVKHNGAPFSGGFAIDTPFGRFYTPNITPDKETGIGNWTEADFVRALKEGRDPQGRNYFPVFPYAYFANVTEADAKAMYAYFMSIPAVKLENKPLLFPFSVPGSRLSLWGWNLLFFFPNTQFSEDPTQSNEWNRGKYIVDGLGHCSMCHTPLNPLGAPKSSYYLTGGFIDGYWAPNITRDGLKFATADEIANEVFLNNKLIQDAGPIAGPMAEVNHNSLSYMTYEDRVAIATYLKSVVSEEPLGLPPSDKEPTLARGRQVYNKACVICHQNGEMSAPLIGDSSSWFFRLKSNGLKDLYQHAINGYNSMPLKGACVTCSDNDIVSAVDYILNRSLTRSQWLDLKPEHTDAAKKIREENA
jgi:cytochrome c5